MPGDRVHLLLAKVPYSQYDIYQETLYMSENIIVLPSFYIRRPEFTSHLFLTMSV
jgi:hypothetical protein